MLNWNMLLCISTHCCERPGASLFWYIQQGYKHLLNAAICQEQGIRRGVQSLWETKGEERQVHKQEKGNRTNAFFVRRMAEGRSMGTALGEDANLLLEKTGTVELGKSLNFKIVWKILLDRGSTAYKCIGVEKDKECLRKFTIMLGAKEGEVRL